MSLVVKERFELDEVKSDAFSETLARVSKGFVRHRMQGYALVFITGPSRGASLDLAYNLLLTLPNKQNTVIVGDKETARSPRFPVVQGYTTTQENMFALPVLQTGVASQTPVDFALPYDPYGLNMYFYDVQGDDPDYQPSEEAVGDGYDRFARAIRSEVLLVDTYAEGVDINDVMNLHAYLNPTNGEPEDTLDADHNFKYVIVLSPEEKAEEFVLYPSDYVASLAPTDVFTVLPGRGVTLYQVEESTLYVPVHQDGASQQDTAVFATGEEGLWVPHLSGTTNEVMFNLLVRNKEGDEGRKIITVFNRHEDTAVDFCAWMVDRFKQEDALTASATESLFDANLLADRKQMEDKLAALDADFIFVPCPVPDLAADYGPTGAWSALADVADWGIYVTAPALWVTGLSRI